jgi:hypothetical protein
VEFVDDLLTRREEMITQVKVHLRTTQNKMTQLANKKRGERSFSIRDYVYSYSNTSSNQWFADHHKNYQLSFLGLA